MTDPSDLLKNDVTTMRISNHATSNGPHIRRTLGSSALYRHFGHRVLLILLRHFFLAHLYPQHFDLLFKGFGKGGTMARRFFFERKEIKERGDNGLFHVGKREAVHQLGNLGAVCSIKADLGGCLELLLPVLHVLGTLLQ